MAVVSDEGTATLSRRRCEVGEQEPRWPRQWQVEMVFDPVTKELWLGRPADRYVVLRKRIWGVSGRGRDLFLMHSQYAGDVQNGEESIMRKFLERFIEQPNIGMWQGEGSLEQFDLLDIYGRVIYSKDASQAANPLRILDATADQRGVTLNMETARGHGLSLTLSETLDILEARKDGRPVRVLFDGRLPRQRKHGFAGVGRFPVVTPGGEMEALSPVRFYSRLDDEGLDRVYATALAAVLPGSGELWIGPDECQLAFWEGQILGVMVGRPQAQELWVFRGRGVTIPGPPEGIAVFDKEAIRFEQEFEASQHQWKPDLRVNIRDLFPGDARFTEDCSFWMRRVSFGDKGLVVLLSSSNSQGHPEVVLSPDLRVVATGVRELNAFGRLEGEPSSEVP